MTSVVDLKHPGVASITPLPYTPLVKMTLKQKQEFMLMQDMKARHDLLTFIKVTKIDYKAGWFHRVLCRELDRFLQAVVAGESPRLIIEAPPRHGKSEIASRRFPAYALGRHPNLQFIATSYASDLASQMNRDVQRVIDSPEYANIFPETKLWGSNIRTVADGSYLRNSDIFEIVGNRGVYKSAGVGAGVTGRGGNVLLVDDPIKDSEEAHSETIREKIWDWFTSTLYTRCESGGGMLVIMTRWHQDDLVGKLLKNMADGGEKWQVLRFPAVAEEDEYDDDGTLLRLKDEALTPARYSREQLERIKLGTGGAAGVGSRVWASLYQQRPAAAEGNTFKRENWQFLKPIVPLEEMSHRERREYFHSLGIRRVIQAWDTALGGKKKNDMAACVTLGVAKNRYYVIDVWAKKLEFPEVLKQIELLHDRWQPDQVAVEGGGSASGKAAVQLLKRETRIPFTSVDGDEHITSNDKEFRSEAIQPTHDAGLVTIFQGGAWVSNFVDQCAGFPNLTNDDDVDAFMIAMEEALGGSKALNITPELLARLGARV